MSRKINLRLESFVVGLGCLLINACADEDSPASYEVDADEGDAGQVERADGSQPVMDAAISEDANYAPDAFDFDDSGLEVPVMAYKVETELGVPATIPGLANKVSCSALDINGDAIAGVEMAVEVRPGTDGVDYELEIEEDGTIELTGISAGTYYVTCKSAELGLRDDSPERWDVDPGPVEVTKAIVEPEEMVAGNVALVTCSATDEQGNALDASEAQVRVLPEGADVEIMDHYVTLTKSGHYEIYCELDGARQKQSAQIDVVPALPAEIFAGVSPLKSFYSPGEVFSFEAHVVDQFGNEVPSANLVWASSPVLKAFGEGRYQSEEEGYYDLGVSVQSATFENRTLNATARVLVDAGGPAVACTRPTGMINGLDQVVLEGTVSDLSGLRALSVDGKPQYLMNDGHFSALVTPHWGLNVHQIEAVDDVGNANSVFCAYFASADYIGENAYLSDAITLHLKQGAIDDYAPSQPITSLIDVIRDIINSSGLSSALDSALSAQNPLINTECQKRVLGVCIFKFGLKYRDISISGPNELSAELVDGGLRVRALIKHIKISLKTDGTLKVGGKFDVYDTNIDLTFDVRLYGGRPKVSLRTTNAMTLGDLDSDFDSALAGWLLDLIFELFENKIRNLLTEKLQDFLESKIDSLLSDVLRNIDLNDLGAQFTVPGIAGGEAATLSLGLDFDSLDVTPSRMRMGIKTKVNGPTRQGAVSAGVPLPPGAANARELRPVGSIGAGINLGLVNQLLHRLWRAGVFQFDNLGAFVGSLPQGVSLSLSMQLPPAVRGAPELSDAAVELHFGPAVGTLIYPGLFDSAITLNLAGKATASAAIEGDQLKFNGIVLENLYIYVDGMEMTPEQRSSLESDLTSILQDLLDHYLNQMLPSVPIPDFALPSSLSSLGVPEGTRLGLREAELKSSEDRFTVEGVFGE